MCENSTKEFGLLTLPIKDLKVIYKEPLELRIDLNYARGGVEDNVDVPILIDKNNYIIDGHHRYFYLAEHDYKDVAVIRLDITFDQSIRWREADNAIKAFSVLTGNNDLYRTFKRLVHHFQ